MILIGFLFCDLREIDWKLQSAMDSSSQLKQELQYVAVGSKARDTEIGDHVYRQWMNVQCVFV